MKQIKRLILTAALLLAAAVPAAHAIDIPISIGSNISVNGQDFTVSTNADGKYVITTSGPAGVATNTPPSNSSDAIARIRQIVEANNPANASFYGTNEYVLSVGAVYAQNSGEGAAAIGIEKYGLLKSIPNIGLGGTILEGNAGGKSGTAGAFGTVDYRRPIGDVAFTVGAGGGYDNYNAKPMGVARAEVEYRQNPHLGEFVGFGYAFEGTKTDRGLMIGGGIHYAF